MNENTKKLNLKSGSSAQYAYKRYLKKNDLRTKKERKTPKKV